MIGARQAGHSQVGRAQDVPDVHRDEPVKCRATLTLLPDLRRYRLVVHFPMMPNGRDAMTDKVENLILEHLLRIPLILATHSRESSHPFQGK